MLQNKEGGWGKRIACEHMIEDMSGRTFKGGTKLIYLLYKYVNNGLNCKGKYQQKLLLVVENFACDIRETGLIVIVYFFSVPEHKLLSHFHLVLIFTLK